MKQPARANRAQIGDAAMRLTFHGACHTVTGSCFMIEHAGAHVLVDCGMFQGSKTEKELNYRAFPFAPAKVDAVVLTHAHIDHSGLLPKLVKAGFKGPIHATAATADLCAVMLPDSGHIQEMEVEQLNRRNVRRGRREVEPIYTFEDAQTALESFRPKPYGQWFDVANGVRARFWNAGHLLGSASVEIEAGEQKLLFSGDIGTKAKLLQTDPTGPAGVDHLICESTYGDRVRNDLSKTSRRAALLAEVQAARARGQALLIPSFAVERTQELLVDLVALIEAGSIAECPIFIDSPLATRATEVFRAHAGELEDGAALVRAIGSDRVRFTETVEQSKAIARLRGFHIILSASGMCEAGRIRHHLRNWLWHTGATVLLVGYQAQGTLGRILQDGASEVRIMGEQIRVGAAIRTLDVYSGHADAEELTEWIAARQPIRGKIFLVHGEERGITGLRDRLATALPATPVITPTLDQCFAIDGLLAEPCAGQSPRLAPEHLGHIDWHNDLSKLVLEIDAAVQQAADEKARARLIRRLRRALHPLEEDIVR
jgi:metallo-beta-lactamase family protein